MLKGAIDHVTIMMNAHVIDHVAIIAIDHVVIMDASATDHVAIMDASAIDHVAIIAIDQAAIMNDHIDQESTSDCSENL